MRRHHPATMPDKKRRRFPALYQRLGGTSGIAAIVEDIVALHLTNPLIRTRFANIEPEERLPDLKKTMCDFFGAGSGGPEIIAAKTSSPRIRA